MTETGTGTRQPVPDYAGSTWASGISVFAATMMIMVGSFQAWEGLVAVVNGDDFLAKTREYVLDFDTTAWGWIHMLIGAAVVLIGTLIFTGNKVARGAGIAVAGVSALSNFVWLPYYPIWSFVVISVDVFVIWALANSNLGER
jgi:hypothetical protein